MPKWEEISDIFTAEGLQKVKVGQIFIFDYEGSKINLKVKRIRDGKVYAERVRLYEQHEMKEMEAEHRRRNRR